VFDYLAYTLCYIHNREASTQDPNITCNFLYRNHQVQRDFLITLYLL